MSDNIPPCCDCGPLRTDGICGPCRTSIEVQLRSHFAGSIEVARARYGEAAVTRELTGHAFQAAYLAVFGPSPYHQDIPTP